MCANCNNSLRYLHGTRSTLPTYLPCVSQDASGANMETGESSSGSEEISVSVQITVPKQSKGRFPKFYFADKTFPCDDASFAVRARLKSILLF